MPLLHCSKDSTNGNQTITLSGTVTLQNQTDYSGVTVSLYRPVQVDADLAAIMQEYSQIGVQSAQLSGFNHMEQTALQSTTTGANGNWSISGVAGGEYNIVAEKPGYGWRHASVNTHRVRKFRKGKYYGTSY